jgi:hypothetical protein
MRRKPMSLLVLQSHDPAVGALGRNDHLAAVLSIGEPASITLSISAAPKSTKATTQYQNNSTMTAPSAPNDWL